MFWLLPSVPPLENHNYAVIYKSTVRAVKAYRVVQCTGLIPRASLKHMLLFNRMKTGQDCDAKRWLINI
jgi:hypothetical protein